MLSPFGFLKYVSRRKRAMYSSGQLLICA
uniref:Uncharacterized protein n=1 Tax=Arundo donax TaxID=35708 RepID=A0A0A9B2B8_ARUDO